MRLPNAGLALLVAGSFACGNRITPKPDDQRVPAASAAASASASSAAADVVAALPALPTWTAEAMTITGAEWPQPYFLDGAVMVSAGQRVGRVVDDRVEWLARQIPKASPALGDNLLTTVVGAWPDDVGVIYTSGNGRALQPAYESLTGKANGYMASPGGSEGLADILGVARVGETTIVAAWTWYGGLKLVPVHGPKLARRALYSKEGGCKPGEVYEPEGHEPAAVKPFEIEGTPDGTMVSIGYLCQRKNPAAEIWDSAGKSHLVDLSPWLKSATGRLLRGKGDDLWLVGDVFRPVLHFHAGTVTPLPFSERPLRAFFTSPTGKLHAVDGQMLVRLEDSGWAPVARLSGPERIDAMAFYGETLWASGGKLFRFHPGAAGDAGPAPDGACASPFVYLYDVSSKNDKAFTYPTTQKALSTFAGVADLGLVEFEDGGRRLGVTVKDKAQGEALIAHLHVTMKDESPRFLCYRPPAPRSIALGQKP
jgi:hypothetical protein